MEGEPPPENIEKTLICIYFFGPCRAGQLASQPADNIEKHLIFDDFMAHGGPAWWPVRQLQILKSLGFNDFLTRGRPAGWSSGRAR